jgi:invasion protein IalB
MNTKRITPMWTSDTLRFAALSAACVAILIAPREVQATQSYQDWRVDCPQKNACVAHFDAAGVQILIGRATPNAPVRMAFRLPAAAKTGTPVAMRLSSGWEAGLRVGGCKKEYCEAGVAEKSTDAALGEFRRGHDGIVAYQLDNRILIIPFSLAGFADAMKAVSS